MLFDLHCEFDFYCWCFFGRNFVRTLLDSLDDALPALEELLDRARRRARPGDGRVRGARVATGNGRIVPCSLSSRVVTRDVVPNSDHEPSYVINFFHFLHSLRSLFFFLQPSIFPFTFLLSTLFLPYLFPLPHPFPTVLSILCHIQFSDQ